LTFVLFIVENEAGLPPPQTPPTSQPVGIAVVTISPPASVMNLGDLMDVRVSLTRPALIDTILDPIVYQVLDDGSYSPIDPSIFLIPQIQVPAGGTSTDFQMQYQTLVAPGNYVLAIVTADEASQVNDPTQFPVMSFASFIIQRLDIRVGVQPLSLAFEEASIWVANQGSGTVSKVAAIDGSDQGAFRVTGVPWAVIFGRDYRVGRELNFGGLDCERRRLSHGVRSLWHYPSNGPHPTATYSVGCRSTR
jgi:hypothetical protein